MGTTQTTISLTTDESATARYSLVPGTPYARRSSARRSRECCDDSYCQRSHLQWLDPAAVYKWSSE